ncbi:type II toxin-antitoxin system RelE/ParE family toxin [Chryseobacterium gotjawalense]|uniref:Type II toxin-antitoxin system RelE/ParE family toxin n=1 Tax=Chryseobacterium gotjawalense TaxID=3042315 RepID=A0ABY8RE74_9FLAO|nr:type II toxin-antitoxin system RelE/ParE family toxin [Chryseobacterium sp. wdc7]WHF51824.1 type II toxin-antitoxin system RelE/ParE family toxin [Chryseobacterium sp. wdc7]
MNELKIRNVFIYKNYFFEFFEKQNQKVKDKIIWTIKVIETIDKIPAEYFKHLEGTNGLYEIRVQIGNNIFRIFCFFDEGKLVVITNGFQKKTQKTPKREIEKALKIKKEYESEKSNSKI